jgi:hypothetical protein
MQLDELFGHRRMILLPHFRVLNAPGRPNPPIPTIGDCEATQVMIGRQSDNNL